MQTKPAVVRNVRSEMTVSGGGKAGVRVAVENRLKTV